MRSFQATLCLALSCGLALVCAAQEAPATLGDVLREYGFEQVIGDWIDAETRGKKLKVTYAWRFEEHLVEISTWSPHEQTTAFMGLNARTGDVYHVGATSRGGGSRGKWDVVDGDAVLALEFTGGRGEQGSMRIRHHPEDDNTILITIEGPEPTQIKLVRIGEAQGPTLAAQFGKLGVAPEVLARVQGALRGAGLEPEQIEPALEGMLKLVMEMRAEGKKFEVDPELVRFLKQEVGLTEEQMETVGGLARRLQFAAGAEREKKASAFTEGATFLHVGTQVGTFDANENLLIEEDELEKGFSTLVERFAECSSQILALFDGDKDGALDKTESQAAREFVIGLVGVLPHDTNRDWRLDNDEADDAWGRLADQCQHYNEAVARKRGKTRKTR